MDMSQQNTWFVYLEDEAPRLGAGWRLIEAKVGRKWAHLRDGMDRRARLPKETWNNIIEKSTRGVS